MERWLIIHGVDFSGAESGGSHKIRIATRHGRTSPVQVERADRKGLLERIRASAADGRPHLWRIDAPMGLAMPTLEEVGVKGWKGCAEWMAGCAGARDWRGSLRTLTRQEPRRECDHELRTPMPPTNLRVFKQTWTFICEILLPLAEAGVRIEPVTPGAPGMQTVVCESCPASDLQRRGWPHKGYKGKGDRPRDVREDILSRVVRAGLVVPESVGEQAIADEEGDLLDALVLALEPASTVAPKQALVEGWVY
ncbi:MAG: hypothetical protein RJA05_691 [Planctomycetota bacterium]